LSENGKRRQLFFDNLLAAKAYVEELKARRDNKAALPQLSVSQLVDAAAAFELLADRDSDTTLVSAVQTYLEIERQRGHSCSVAELFDRFRRAKETKSASYKRDLRWAYDKMTPFMKLAASDITPAHIAQALAGMPASSANNCLRALRALFRYALDLELIAKVPVRRGDFAHSARKEVQVLPVLKIRELLEAALIHIPEILPLLLVETFAGIRPEEAARLAWSDIDLVKARVVVRAAISKTASGRSIKLADCALAWFRACPIGISGPIAPWSAQSLRTRMRKVRLAAGYRGRGVWRPGSLRDAFCSYHLAHYGSIDRLVTEAGHTDLRTTKDHYLGLVSSEAAAEFWNLYPPGHQANVVQFASG
jgi:integrase